MKLRFVSIEGFKGISNRVDLELSPTLTVIFGPNFYGKSSIIEAIQWCLYCNSLYYEDEKDRWRKIREIFKDIKIINERRPKATVIIEYEHNGQMFRMFAETKTEEGYGFKAYDNGSFKELTLGELELTPFIRVVTTSQTRRFESEEDLKALDIVFNVIFWREFSDSAKRIADDILEKEKMISEKIYKWRDELGKIYIETMEKYEDAEVRAGSISLDDIRKDLAELLNCSIDEIPSNLDDLIEFARKIRNPYGDKIDEKYNEKNSKV
jgi:predicted ATP-dependent endonuclease of OLD family